jgi:hypothetical protein
MNLLEPVAVCILRRHDTFLCIAIVTPAKTISNFFRHIVVEIHLLFHLSKR